MYDTGITISQIRREIKALKRKYAREIAAAVLPSRSRPDLSSCGTSPWPKNYPSPTPSPVSKRW